MSETNKYGQEFLDNYMQVMGGAWRSEAEETSLISDPTAFATEKGLPVSPGAVVKLDQSQPDGLFTVEQLTRDWLATPGVHILHVPAEELVNEADLSDAELETVAGGTVIFACVIIA